MTAYETHCSTDDNMGYGRLGKYIVEALNKRGIETTQEEGKCEASWWACPPSHIRGWYAGQRRYVTAMFEATHLPDGLHETIHEFDAVFVPSRQNMEIFAPVHDNVILCHLGVDPYTWRYKERKPFDGFFNVYAPGQGNRKGTDVAVQAFKLAFPKNYHFDPQPKLILKALTREEYEDDRFEHVSGVISSGEEMALHEYAHASLNLARGEGFGLFPIQAIAQGIPTVLTDAHGHAEFSHLAQPVSAALVPAGQFLYGDVGDWWEPNVDDAVDHLRDIYFNYDKHLAFAKEASAVCLRDFTWDKTAGIIATEIGDSTWLTEPGEWEPTTVRKFLTRVNKYVDPYIGGVSYELERNHDYWCSADVRRVLIAAGYIDESCLVDQLGKLVTNEPLGVKAR